jgi:hypothetical protein
MPPPSSAHTARNTSLPPEWVRLLISIQWPVADIYPGRFGR